MALKRISLSNFVIVQSLDVDLQLGFNVLTGETGAGKSILIDALQLVLGARSDTSFIREGADKTEIAAEFDCPESLRPWLEESGFETNEELLIRRIIDTQGKSRSWINGSAATATQLRHVGDALLDIHGQHAWQSLTKPESIRALLDAYAGIETTKIFTLWNQWRSDVARLEAALIRQESQQQELERLEWQIREVSRLAPLADEWPELEQQHQRMGHVQSLIEAAQNASHHLNAERTGTQSSLNAATHALQNLAEIEPQFHEWADVLSSAAAQISDVSYSLKNYIRRTETDSSSSEDLENRVTQWLQLSKKYRCQPQDLFTRLQSWQMELQTLAQANDLDALKNAAIQSEKAYLQLAKAFSEKRQSAALLLSADITASMQELGMLGGVFETAVTPAKIPAPHGTDQIEFLVAGHPGTKPKPIHKVASGGELSRIALAISVKTSTMGTASTLVFDEVDAGIGGATAETVGRLMRQLGQDKQVIAVTHLPQVAAYANHHLLVSKSRSKSGTTSVMHAIDRAGRVSEIARMLGGEQTSPATLAHASEMLSFAQKK